MIGTLTSTAHMILSKIFNITPRLQLLSIGRRRLKKPVVSSYTVPGPDGHFRNGSGRFGSYASNESMTPASFRKIAFISHFNAGARAHDIRNPYASKEIGYYIPQ
jgi:hypothetical protein